MGDNSTCEVLNATVKCSWSDSPGVSSLKDWLCLYEERWYTGLQLFQATCRSTQLVALPAQAVKTLLQQLPGINLHSQATADLPLASASTFIRQHVEKEQDRFQLLKHKQRSAFIHFVFCQMWHSVNLQQSSFVFLFVLWFFQLQPTLSSVLEHSQICGRTLNWRCKQDN